MSIPNKVQVILAFLDSPATSDLSPHEISKPRPSATPRGPAVRRAAFGELFRRQGQVTGSQPLLDGRSTPRKGPEVGGSEEDQVVGELPRRSFRCNDLRDPFRFREYLCDRHQGEEDL